MRSYISLKCSTTVPLLLYFCAALRCQIWSDFFNFCPGVAVYYLQVFMLVGLGGANPAVNTPRPSRGTRIESCDFIVLIGDPWFFLFVSFCLASRVEWERWALSISFVWHVACDVWLSGDLFFWGGLFYFQIIACVLTFLGPFISFRYVYPFWVVSLWPRKASASVGPVRMLESTE